jgi:hypothetical protein
MRCASRRPSSPAIPCGVRFRFVERRPTRNPERGIVIEALDLLNQRDEVVTAARHISLILTQQADRDATASP